MPKCRKKQKLNKWVLVENGLKAYLLGGSVKRNMYLTNVLLILMFPDVVWSPFSHASVFGPIKPSWKPPVMGGNSLQHLLSVGKTHVFQAAAKSIEGMLETKNKDFPEVPKPKTTSSEVESCFCFLSKMVVVIITSYFFIVAMRLNNGICMDMYIWYISTCILRVYIYIYICDSILLFVLLYPCYLFTSHRVWIFCACHHCGSYLPAQTASI